MNQSILFNDDLYFNEQEDAWCFTGQLSGEVITIYIHSIQLKQLVKIDSCTKFDLEELAEQWFDTNEPEDNYVHIYI